ncbi:MAG TPA: RNA polymerase sigma-70 factor [Conexibacter sp.]|nr:RNA polymerase sigma-70 factor [Conexibacter sp.]
MRHEPTSDYEFEALGRHGFAVAYRMLGSVSEAEDIVQEALLRLSQREQPLDEPAAWITTVVTRLSIDHLRLARVKRESYVGPWIPEPVIAESAPGPAAHVELVDSLSQAFLVVLEHLTPVERAAFLLREVFDYDYAQIAEIVDRSEANCRQLVARARKHLAARRPRFDPDEALRDKLLERFLAAAEEGDVTALEELLAEDVVLYGDGGGKVMAATEPVIGGAMVAAFVADITRRRREIGDFELERVTVNGQPGRILRSPDGTVWDVLSLDVVDGRIQTVRIVRNPDKLAHL